MVEIILWTSESFYTCSYHSIPQLYMLLHHSTFILHMFDVWSICVEAKGLDYVVVMWRVQKRLSVFPIDTKRTSPLIFQWKKGMWIVNAISGHLFSYKNWRRGIIRHLLWVWGEDHLLVRVVCINFFLLLFEILRVCEILLPTLILGLRWEWSLNNFSCFIFICLLH